MDTTFKIIASDGKEYGPLDENTLKRWFIEKRVQPATLIFSYSSNQWLPLNQLFDLTQWGGSDPLTPLYPLSGASSTVPTQGTPILRQEVSPTQPNNIDPPKKDVAEAEKPKGLGCLTSEIFIALALWFIIRFVLIVITNGRGTLGSPGIVDMIILGGIASWIVTRVYKRRMEKRLGRKLKGEYELTSLYSWMEVKDKKDNEEK